jgi:hypothetical protein
MHRANLNPESSPLGNVSQSGRPRVEAVSRLDFRRASYHLNPKTPRYYLVLLRSELRGRSLRGKPGADL